MRPATCTRAPGAWLACMTDPVAHADHRSGHGPPPPRCLALLSRREMLASGSLLLLAGLSGCQNASVANASGGGEPLPSPVTPGRSPTPPQAPAAPPVSPVPGPTGPIQVAGLQVIPRSAWTTAGVVPGRPIKPLGQVLRITVHHEGATVYGSTDQGDAARRLASIRQSHISRATDGVYWADIGYHYVIDPAGRVWEGRSLQHQGAHVHLQNENNLGVMVLGNFDKQSPSRAQTAALEAFLASRMRQYRVPVSRVYTHQEIGQTACPGQTLQRYMIASRGPAGGLRIV